MATFAEICYACLDLLKSRSDDSYYTEEHVLFFAKKVRATLLEKKYKQTRNSSFSQISGENKQQICLQLEPASMLPGSCGGKWLRSTDAIPSFLSGFDAVTCTGHDLLPTNVTFIPAERIPYVGYNKWLKNIIYAAKSIDDHLYITSNNPQFIFLEHVGLTGVFADPEEAARLSHEACMSGGMCDLMSQKFPLEASLVSPLIELVAQELLGSKYAPEDKANNAKDDMSDIAYNPRASKRVDDTANQNQEQAQ